MPQRIVGDGFIRKVIFKAARKKRKIFCFAERGEIKGGIKEVERINKVGKLHVISTLADGEGIRKVRDFLSLLVTGFAKQVSVYMNETWEAPFVFRERQLHTFLAPTLSKFTDVFLMEAPVHRKWSSISSQDYNDSHGWVDYWCFYRNLVFLIELKHGFLSGRTGTPNKNVKNYWVEAVQQLDVIQDYADIQSQDSGGAFRIALQVLPIYETVNDSMPKIIGNTDKLLEIQKNCMEAFKPEPNWSMLWQLHESITGPFEYANTKEFYPGIVFLSRVSEIHKG